MTHSLSGKKVLILYTAHTMGHARIASNIGYWLSEAGATVVLREVLKSNPSPLVKYFLRVHIWVNTHVPQLWNMLYRYGFWVVMMPWRLITAWLNRGEIAAIVQSETPDLIITTQTSPSAVVNVLKWSRAYTGAWGIAFSDYHFHRAWMYPRADWYCTNIPEQGAQLMRRGVASEAIYQIGFALPPRDSVDMEMVRKRIGIPQGAAVVLVGSGSLGVRVPEELFLTCQSLVERMRAKGTECRVVVACGRNQVLQRELIQRVKQGWSWLIPLGYYDPMSELYAIAHLFITKPGGLSIIEAAQWGVPTAVTHILPGQEELNVAYLQEHAYVTNLTHTPPEQWVGACLALLTGADPSPHTPIPDAIQSAGAAFPDWVATQLECAHAASAKV